MAGTRRRMDRLRADARAVVGLTPSGLQATADRYMYAPGVIVSIAAALRSRRHFGRPDALLPSRPRSLRLPRRRARLPA